jgi:hypothetical protein
LVAKIWGEGLISRGAPTFIRHRPAAAPEVD